MLRSLWTGASGMIAQQTNVDNIANNLANVNTTGYKKITTEFSTLLYQKLQTKVTDKNGDPKPVLGQVGLGSRVAGLSTRFSQGILTSTENDFDFAIEGKGFFRVQMPDGSIAYTRNGTFATSLTADGGVALSTSEGHPVLDTSGAPIVLGPEYPIGDLDIDDTGNLWYPNKLIKSSPEDPGVLMWPEYPQDQMVELNIKMSIVQFNNPAGLEKLSGSLYAETENSGGPRFEVEDGYLRQSKIIRRYVEGSNVQTVDEVVNLIVAQRAYEMNSKIVTASDEMMQQANNLRS